MVVKYSINVYNEDGSLAKTYGTDFVSTNTFIKAVKAMQEIEGETSVEKIVSKLATVVSYLIPSLDEATIMYGCDVADLINLVKQVVAKINGVEQPKN